MLLTSVDTASARGAKRFAVVIVSSAIVQRSLVASAGHHRIDGRAVRGILDDVQSRGWELGEELDVRWRNQDVWRCKVEDRPNAASNAATGILSAVIRGS